jgi:selenocysteine lyase/cysteine desulfurase
MDEMLEAARAAVLRAVGASSDWTVSFCSSATDALNLVASAVRPTRARIVVSEHEHPSGLLSMSLQTERGFRVRALPGLPVETWVERVQEARAQSDLVVLSHLSYRTGVRAPFERLTESPASGGLVLADVSQSLGHLDITTALRVADVVVGLGHKWLHGPYPTGFLLLSPRARETLAIPRGGWHARNWSALFEASWRTGGERFEPGSVDVARAVGLTESLGALSYWHSPASRGRVTRFRSYVAQTLGRLGYPPLEGAEDGMLVSPLRPPWTARMLAAELLRMGITVKDLNPPECPDLLRISLVPLHTDNEVDRLCASLAQALSQSS